MTNHKHGLDSLIDVGIFTGRLKGKAAIVPLPMHTYIHTYTLFIHGRNISYKIIIKKNKTVLHVCRVGVRGGQLVIYPISETSIGSNGSDVRWKAIPRMCSTIGEATFQKIGTGLR